MTTSDDMEDEVDNDPSSETQVWSIPYLLHSSQCSGYGMDHT